MKYFDFVSYVSLLGQGEEKEGEIDHTKEETYQDVPPLIVIKSNNNLVFKPNLAANAIASADDAI